MTFMVQCGCGLTEKADLPNATNNDVIQHFRKLGWEFTTDGNQWCPVHRVMTKHLTALQLLDVTPQDRVERLQNKVSHLEQLLVHTKAQVAKYLQEVRETQRELDDARAEETRAQTNTEGTRDAQITKT